MDNKYCTYTIVIRSSSFIGLTRRLRFPQSICSFKMGNARPGLGLNCPRSHVNLFHIGILLKIRSWVSVKPLRALCWGFKIPPNVASDMLNLKIKTITNGSQKRVLSECTEKRQKPEKQQVSKLARGTSSTKTSTVVLSSYLGQQILCCRVAKESLSKGSIQSIG